MPRKNETPKINMVTVTFNGDSKLFNTFMESMISDYLGSDSMPKCSSTDFSDKVEVSENLTKSLDLPSELWYPVS